MVRGDMRRVVVTGLGLVTPLGANTKTTWEKLVANKSGIRKIDSNLFDISDLATTIAGIVPLANEEGGLDLDKFIDPKDQRKMDQFIHFAIAAANEAVTDSGWVPSSEEHKRRNWSFNWFRNWGLANNSRKCLDPEGKRSTTN